MTSPGRSMDDYELDLLLRAMLADEAVSVPERIAQQALVQVSMTPQRHPVALRARPMLARRATQVWLAAAVAILTLAVLASLIGSGPTPGPSPTPSPTVPPLVTTGAAGFELLVPGTWDLEEPPPFPDAQRWTGPDGQLMVGFGSSILEGGEVSVCGPPSPEWPLCQTDSYTYSVPFDPATDGVGPLDLSGYARDRCEGGCPIETAETTLGGEPASESRIVSETANQRAIYVSLFHERRPVILTFIEPLSSADDDRFETIRASFRFVATTPAVSPTPFVDPTELIPFIDADAGYEFLIPRFWAERTAEVPAGVHQFGSGRGFGTRGSPAITISVGTADGTVVVCQGMSMGCDPVVVDSLDALEAALRVNGEDVDEGVPAEVIGDIVLDGTDGRWKHPGYPTDDPRPDGLGEITEGNCLGCPSVLYHAYMIKDGRPIVISIDFWTVAFGEIDADYLRAILDSVQLIGS